LFGYYDKNHLPFHKTSSIQPINSLYFFGMKIIVVPTDFSPFADNAMNYAAQLAEKTGASLLLVHVYQIPISMNDVPVLMISAEELKDSADRGLENAKTHLEKKFPGIVVKTESRLGDVVNELEELALELKPLAIVVGKHGASGVERLLFGSTTLSIIRHLKFPVISVPDGVNYQLNHIALAADNGGFTGQEEKIKNFVEETKAKLHIVHVQETGKDTPGLKNILPQLNPVYETVRNEEFVRGIQSYVKTHAIDMLMVLPHKHSLMERLFFKPHTTELIEKLKIPVLTIQA